ncbi:amidase family protein [Actinomadura sp. J1-007]|uniref:amidase family protein n=1 Tax=Actinomadura sp. J1-007 TaxID=2661913 RepID=UPI0019D534C5|nr:amidase family protein [Actinomadura sp. J1-007]
MAWIEPWEVDPEVGRVARAPFADAPVEHLDLEAVRDVYAKIQPSEAYGAHAERVASAPELFQPEILEGLHASARIPAWRFLRATRDRAEFGRRVDGLLARHDVLALPTTSIAPTPIGEREHAFGYVPAVLMGLTCPWNLAGLPALSVPAGTVGGTVGGTADGAGGLPVGVQLVTRAGAEDLLFEVAERVVERLAAGVRVRGVATAG